MKRTSSYSLRPAHTGTRLSHRRPSALRLSHTPVRLCLHTYVVRQKYVTKAVLATAAAHEIHRCCGAKRRGTRTVEPENCPACPLYPCQSLSENRAVVCSLCQRPRRVPVRVVFDRGRVRAVDVHGGHPRPSRRWSTIAATRLGGQSSICKAHWQSPCSFTLFTVLLSGKSSGDGKLP